jgi:hypothetical protein
MTPKGVTWIDGACSGLRSVAHAGDLPLLIEIERLAGAVFRSLGMDLVADDDPGSADELAPYAEDGRAFVAVDASDRPVAYLLVDAVDGPRTSNK